MYVFEVISILVTVSKREPLPIPYNFQVIGMRLGLRRSWVTSTKWQLAPLKWRSHSWKYVVFEKAPHVVSSQAVLSKKDSTQTAIYQCTMRKWSFKQREGNTILVLQENSSVHLGGWMDPTNIQNSMAHTTKMTSINKKVMTKTRGC